MALTSPGVEVTIIDQSQYLPAATNSIPLVVFATAQDKANPNGTGVASGTTAANAGKLVRVTSQRDLTTLYGTPFFYTSTNGTPQQGYELNEYGLLAAYSALGATNSLYALRADIDLSSLEPSAGRPTGAPQNGAYWLDTTTSTWGIYEWNAETQTFDAQTPIVITDFGNVTNHEPLGSVGSIGDYAVIVAADTTGAQGPQLYYAPTNISSKQFFYKNSQNNWEALGSPQWQGSVPTVTGTLSPSTLSAGNTFTITIGTGANQAVATITVPAAPNNTVEGVANAIVAKGWQNLSAGETNGRLSIYSVSTTSHDYITIAAGTGTVLTDLGITAGNYYLPALELGSSSELPLWKTGQSAPRPSGSVWLKIGSSGNGLVSKLSTYNATAESFVNKAVNYYVDDAEAIESLDATGGQAIPAGTVYAQYDWQQSTPYVNGPVYYWRRLATGPTVATGLTTDPTFNSGPYSATIRITTPNSAGWSSPYTMTLADNSDAADFVTAWQAAAIPYTTAAVTTDGAIQITHTEGGSIRIDDTDDTTGLSSGLLNSAGFEVAVYVPSANTFINNTNVKWGYIMPLSFTASQSATSGGGTGVQLTISSYAAQLNVTAIAAGGAGYTVGDTITIAAADVGNPGGQDYIVKVAAVSGGAVTAVTNQNGVGRGGVAIEHVISNWVPISPPLVANEGAPTSLPANNQNWFYNSTNQVDIMINTSSGWKGYKNVNYDSSGFPLPSGTNVTSVDGPIVSATAPETEQDGSPLAYGDLWVDTSAAALENYPVISRWQALVDNNGSPTGEDGWVLIDNTDQVTSSGILFADARWSSNQNTINPANDPLPTIKSLLLSNNLDLDAPDTNLYPVGMLLFNTRRSGYNVKQWKNNYFNQNDFPDETLPTIRSTWVSASGLQSDGAPYMGRKAQRAMVVASLRSVIETNQEIRDEDNNFNLLATPNYPECQPTMVGLNNERGNTGYILGDTPMGLPMQATLLQAWATNAANATSTGESGCVTRDPYLGLFYPSGIATDLSGNEVAVPPSHMMLRTFLRNDTIAYPWFAAAGTRRGLIDNALNIGYVDRETGEFQPVKPNIGIRDVLYTNYINPLVFFTGNGLLNYGNKSSQATNSALDRTNVARLIAYIRRQLTIAARPFVFEPNDAITREQISGVVESLMVDLVAKRGIYDYLVVCDESNNTPARIDRNELWIDVAIEPVKAAEFIYIPVRILNTGELAGA